MESFNSCCRGDDRSCDKYPTKDRYRPLPFLFKSLRGKVSEGVILYRVAELDGIATHFTVFDIGVVTDREIEDH